MCLLCIEFQKQQMTILEARRALGEMRVAMEPAHVKEVEEMLSTAEIEAEVNANSASSASVVAPSAPVGQDD